MATRAIAVRNKTLASGSSQRSVSDNTAGPVKGAELEGDFSLGVKKENELG